MTEPEKISWPFRLLGHLIDAIFDQFLQALLNSEFGLVLIPLMAMGLGLIFLWRLLNPAPIRS